MDTYIDVGLWLTGRSNKKYIKCFIIHSYKDKVFIHIQGFKYPEWIPKTFIFQGNLK